MKRTISSTPTFSRRRVLTAIAVASCGHIWPSRLSAETPQMSQVPSSATNKTRTALHQEIKLNASPRRIFDVLLSSKDFAAFSGVPADIDPKAGGAFSMFGGMIVGRNVELVPGQRIVQAWRPADWPPGLYSLVRFELKPAGTGTLLILDHSSFPAGDYDHLSSGWHEHYWQPLKKFLA